MIPDSWDFRRKQRLFIDTATLLLPEKVCRRAFLHKLVELRQLDWNDEDKAPLRAEHLQAAESRISDVDVDAEMTAFVRNQILTQSAVALLGQANSLSRMLIGLIEA